MASFKKNSTYVRQLLLVLKSFVKTYSTPPVSLKVIVIAKATKFKYLGQRAFENLTYDIDLERKCVTLSIRCNTQVRKFACCSLSKRITLFKTQSHTTHVTCLANIPKMYRPWSIQFYKGFRGLLGQSRYCSVSRKFSEARFNGFKATVCKRNPLCSQWGPVTVFNMTAETIDRQINH